MQLTRMAALVGVALGLACGGDGGGDPGPTPTQMAVSSGNNQVGAAGTMLAQPLAVVVRDVDAEPVSGVTVNWAVGSGGGSVSAATSTTNVGGIATITRTLGANAGTQTATATRAGLTGSPVTFTATAQIQGATQMALDGGNGQTDTVLTELSSPYTVLVRDQSSSPVAGVNVSWAATAGGGSVSAATSTTNASGIASITHTFGSTAGAQTVQASVTGLQGSPVSFSSTADPGNPVQLVKTAGDGGQAVVNGTVIHTVAVRDAHGNGVAGVAIDWAAATGGGSIDPPNNTTAGASGTASATRTLSGTAGDHTSTATASGLSGSPATFTVTAVTAAATASVSLMNTQFIPDSVMIALNGTVDWTWNDGSIVHNVTFDNVAGAPANISDRNSGTQPRTFNTAGTFTYSCTLHPGMDGKVVVVN